MAGKVQVNVALDDPLVSEEGTLPPWLQDEAQCVAGRCVARVWRQRRGQCARGLCWNGRRHGGDFCGWHGRPDKRPFGRLDPENGHRSWTRKPGDCYDMAVREARLREEKAGGGPPAEPAALAAGRKARVLVLRPNRVGLPW